LHIRLELLIRTRAQLGRELAELALNLRSRRGQAWQSKERSRALV
jgi:hypothetical protein